MARNQSKLNWVWVIVGVVLAFVIAYVGIFCVVSVYATSLAVQSRGAPDMDAINLFAAANAAAVQSIFIGLGTFVGGLVAARRAKAEASSHSVAVGLVTTLVALVLSLLGGFTVWGIIGIALALLGGYFAGFVVQRRRAK